MGSFLKQKIDFAKHNDERLKIWEAYNQRKPIRVPIVACASISSLLQNPEINTTGYTFEDYFKNPQAHIECQLVFLKWCRYNLVCDSEMGPPKNGWQVTVDFQNSWEAGWLGCPLHYFGNGVPDTSEILQDDKSKLYQLKAPDALRGGLLGRAMEFFDYMQAKCPQMEFEGLPVKPPVTIPGEKTDGPFDVAYKLRGAAEVCLDMYEDPKYYHDLMAFITENVIRRMKAIRQWRWARNPDAPDKGKFKGSWGFADDAIAMISTRDYEQFVFPYHKRLVEEFSDGSPVYMHLCGDATRHFKFLRDRLNVQTFDTGFPVDFAWLRQELGPNVQINGGPTIMLLKDGKPEQIRKEVKRICESGIMQGGRFVLREANNMAPCTPIENIAAMYAAGKEFGRY
ncbi:MAG: uroporphyrinogen decarboxylase family protein [Kiritimatiellia bacterium]|jgi:uroporphyrinogen-III decarboxylase